MAKEWEEPTRLTVVEAQANVAFSDDFEGTNLHWIESGTAGYTFALSTDYAMSGEKSAKIVTHSTNGASVTISKNGPGQSTGIGYYSCHLMTLEDPANVEIHFTPFCVTELGVKRLFPGLRWDDTAAAWLFYNSVGSWAATGMTSFSWSATAPRWNFIQLKCDWTTGKYVEAKVNSQTVNLRAESIRNIAGDSTDDRHGLNLAIQSTGALATKTVYIDNVMGRTEYI